MQEKRTNHSPAGKARTARFAALVCVLAIGASALAYLKQMKAESLSTAAQPQIVERPDADDVLPPAQRNAGRSVDAAKVDEAPRPQPEAPAPGKPAPEAQTSFTIAMPVEGDLVQLYSMDHLSYDPTTRDWRTHDGIDIRAAVGADVRAAADGTVASVEEDKALGTVVTIRHAGGFLTRYGNLDPGTTVQAGQTVRQGEVIGCVGGSALMEAGQESHLHFALCAGEASVNPTDYFAW